MDIDQLKLILDAFANTTGDAKQLALVYFAYLFVKVIGYGLLLSAALYVVYKLGRQALGSADFEQQVAKALDTWTPLNGSEQRRALDLIRKSLAQ